MAKIDVVGYTPEYRDMVRDCVYVTGYGGESAEVYFECRELFADMITLYYTDYEPESAFIALADGEPAGYLLGALDTRKYEQTMEKEIIPLLLKNMLSGKYELGAGARRNLSRAMLSQIRGEGGTPPLDMFPAHLHIDLYEQFRRAGVGSALMNAYLDFLRGKGVRGVHLGTSSFHTQSLPFYEKHGFYRYRVSRMEVSLFKGISGRDFYHICFVKNLL